MVYIDRCNIIDLVFLILGYSGLYGQVVFKTGFTVIHISSLMSRADCAKHVSTEHVSGEFRKQFHECATICESLTV